MQGSSTPTSRLTESAPIQEGWKWDWSRSKLVRCKVTSQADHTDHIWVEDDLGNPSHIKTYQLYATESEWAENWLRNYDEAWVRHQSAISNQPPSVDSAIKGVEVAKQILRQSGNHSDETVLGESVTIPSSEALPDDVAKVFAEVHLTLDEVSRIHDTKEILGSFSEGPKCLINQDIYLSYTEGEPRHYWLHSGTLPEKTILGWIQDVVLPLQQAGQQPSSLHWDSIERLKPNLSTWLRVVKVAPTGTFETIWTWDSTLDLRLGVPMNLDSEFVTLQTTGFTVRPFKSGESADTLLEFVRFVTSRPSEVLKCLAHPKNKIPGVLAAFDAFRNPSNHSDDTVLGESVLAEWTAVEDCDTKWYGGGPINPDAPVEVKADLHYTHGDECRIHLPNGTISKCKLHELFDSREDWARSYLAQWGAKASVRPAHGEDGWKAKIWKLGELAREILRQPTNHSDETVLGEAKERLHRLNRKVPLYATWFEDVDKPTVVTIVKVTKQAPGASNMFRPKEAVVCHLQDGKTERLYPTDQIFPDPLSAIDANIKHHSQWPDTSKRTLEALKLLRKQYESSNHSDDTVLGESRSATALDAKAALKRAGFTLEKNGETWVPPATGPFSCLPKVDIFPLGNSTHYAMPSRIGSTSETANTVVRSVANAARFGHLFKRGQVDHLECSEEVAKKVAEFANALNTARCNFTVRDGSVAIRLSNWFANLTYRVDSGECRGHLDINGDYQAAYFRFTTLPSGAVNLARTISDETTRKKLSARLKAAGVMANLNEVTSGPLIDILRQVAEGDTPSNHSDETVLGEAKKSAGFRTGDVVYFTEFKDGQYRVSRATYEEKNRIYSGWGTVKVDGETDVTSVTHQRLFRSVEEAVNNLLDRVPPGKTGHDRVRAFADRILGTTSNHSDETILGESLEDYPNIGEVRYLVNLVTLRPDGTSGLQKVTVTGGERPGDGRFQVTLEFVDTPGTYSAPFTRPEWHSALKTIPEAIAFAEKHLDTLSKDRRRGFEILKSKFSGATNHSDETVLGEAVIYHEPHDSSPKEWMVDMSQKPYTLHKIIPDRGRTGDAVGLGKAFSTLDQVSEWVSHLLTSPRYIGDRTDWAVMVEDLEELGHPVEGVSTVAA